MDPFARKRYRDPVECLHKRSDGVLVRQWRFGVVANHLQCDHQKGVRNGTDLRSRVVSLCSNIELLTAIANDIGYHDVFAHQLQAQSQPGDVLVAISSSGRSPNIIRALQWGRDNGLRTIALTGFSGGDAREIAEAAVHVDSENYGIVEDLHQSIMHAMAQYIRQTRMSADHCVEHVLMAIHAGTSEPASSSPSELAKGDTRMRVAINLLSEDPHNPSGAHWFWTRMVPEMVKRRQGEELLMPVEALRVHPDCSDRVTVITFRWSNEHRVVQKQVNTSPPLSIRCPPYRRTEHWDRSAVQPFVITRNPHQDDACVHVQAR